MSEFQLLVAFNGEGKTFSIVEVFTGGGKNSYLYEAAYRMKLIATCIPMRFFNLYKNSLAKNGYSTEQVPQEPHIHRFYKV